MGRNNLGYKRNRSTFFTCVLV